MNATWLIGIVGTALLLSATASARTHDEAELQGYEAGWDAAQKFCEDLRPRETEELPVTTYMLRMELETRDIIGIFSEACKEGFKGHINNNWACQQRMEDESAYSDMWKARHNACD